MSLPMPMSLSSDHNTHIHNADDADERFAVYDDAYQLLSLLRYLNDLDHGIIMLNTYLYGSSHDELITYADT